MQRQLFFLTFLIFTVKIWGQERKTCYILYKNLGDPSWTYPHWFDDKKLTFTSEIEYFVKEFPVVLNDGKIIHTNDTLTYKKQYLDFKNGLNANENKEKNPISAREYTSNILRRHSYISDKKYLVVDTIADMTNWNILEDTINILGLKCQKAIINYKGKKYIAFFTTKFTFPAGPRNYRGLPGLILKVVNEANTAGYEAIEMQYPFKGKVPSLETDGTLVSQNQYQVLVDESNKLKMKMMSNFMQNPTVKPN